MAEEAAHAYDDLARADYERRGRWGPEPRCNFPREGELGLNKVGEIIKYTRHSKHVVIM
jgi:hypothetical protein